MNEIKYSNFIIAGAASVGATVFTNPLEVCIFSYKFIVIYTKQ